jgi:hypothetical protein
MPPPILTWDEKSPCGPVAFRTVEQLLSPDQDSSAWIQDYIVFAVLLRPGLFVVRRKFGSTTLFYN